MTKTSNTSKKHLETTVWWILMILIFVAPILLLIALAVNKSRQEGRKQEFADTIAPIAQHALNKAVREYSVRVFSPTNKIGDYAVWFTGLGIEAFCERPKKSSGDWYCGGTTNDLKSIKTLILVFGDPVDSKTYDEVRKDQNDKTIGVSSKVVFTSILLEVWVVELKTEEVIGHQTFAPPTLKSRYYSGQDSIMMDLKNYKSWLNSIK